MGSYGFDPIVVDDTVIIYDAKHASDLHPGQSEDHIEIGIDAVQAFERARMGDNPNDGFHFAQYGSRRKKNTRLWMEQASWA